MSWTVPPMWDGADVWILGGGPSVAEQFDIPKEVVQNVKNGTSPLSVFSPYMKALHNKHVIGINVAFQIGDWIDMCFWGDKNFYLQYREKISQFPGIKASCCHPGSVQDWVKFIEKDTEHPRGISTRPNAVSWNHNSGSAAISIAAWAGAKRIILLGFDMTIGEDKRMHFHDVYNRGAIDTDDKLRKWQGTFDRHLRNFPYIAMDAKVKGIEIINASPNSMIPDFPKCSLKDLLKEKL